MSAARERRGWYFYDWANSAFNTSVTTVFRVRILRLAPSIGLSTGDAVRIGLLSAGAWWGLFTLVPLRTLQDRPPPGPVDHRVSAVSAGVATGTSWIGPLLFGLALQVTDSYRIAIVSLVVFFVTGGLLLALVDVERATGEADTGLKHAWR